MAREDDAVTLISDAFVRGMTKAEYETAVRAVVADMSTGLLRKVADLMFADCDDDIPYASRRQLVAGIVKAL